MKGIVKFILGAGLCVVIVAGAITVLPGLLGGAADDIKNQAINAAIDASGVKDKVEGALNENVAALAAATGLSEEDVSAAIATLDISSWGVTTLPEGAIAYDTFPIAYEGLDATVTTYEDPSYVTVNALGQTLTLAVPKSAQPYVDLLQFAQFIQ